MKKELPISRTAREVVVTLQQAGFTAYIVGGAIRDLLLGYTPKDFDIVTSAALEEVRHTFGRRNTRLIGKRFRIAHVTCRGELFEVSTFHGKPPEEENPHSEEPLRFDNTPGTEEEDAMRRDFTVNALFYDPVTHELIDHTGMGLNDIRDHVVRAIGVPQVRFEEDPVRMLRALKLVAQYDFALDSATENALFNCLELLKLASPSRLALELEKIFESCNGDKHFRVFHDYGLLAHYLPELERNWETPAMRRALELLYERNCRLDEGRYRNSISLAMSCVALPFVETKLNLAPGQVLPGTKKASAAISEVLRKIFLPLHMMERMTLSAERILGLQHCFEPGEDLDNLFESRSYPNARELMLIRSAVAKLDVDTIDRKWPLSGTGRGKRPIRRK